MATGKVSPLLTSEDVTLLKNVGVKIVVKLKLEKLEPKRK